MVGKATWTGKKTQTVSFSGGEIGLDGKVQTRNKEQACHELSDAGTVHSFISLCPERLMSKKEAAVPKSTPLNLTKFCSRGHRHSLLEKRFMVR